MVGGRRLWANVRLPDVEELIGCELYVLVDRKGRPRCAMCDGFLDEGPGPSYVPGWGHHGCPDGAGMGVCRACGRRAAAAMRDLMPGDWNTVCMNPQCEEHRGAS